MSKKSRFRGAFDKQHGNWDETLLKSELHHLYLVYWSLWYLEMQVSWKTFFLVIFKDLRVFLNTLTANDKCFLFDGHNLWQPIQNELSEKQKKISKFFSAILKSWLNFKHFQKEDERHSWCISEIKDSKNFVK